MTRVRPIPYVNEEVSSRDFKFYIFDWCNNFIRQYRTRNCYNNRTFREF